MDQWPPGRERGEPRRRRLGARAIRGLRAEEVRGRRQLLVRGHPGGRHRGEVAVDCVARGVGGQAELPAGRRERGQQRGLRPEPERPRGRVGQPQPLRREARAELVPLPHEEVRPPPPGEREQVGRRGARRGVAPVAHDPARALGAGRWGVGEGARELVGAPVEARREGGEAGHLDLGAEGRGTGDGHRVARPGKRAREGDERAEHAGARLGREQRAHQAPPAWRAVGLGHDEAQTDDHPGRPPGALRSIPNPPC